MKAKSIVLLSGGLDSAVSAVIAVRRTKVLFALTIDYGQRAGKQEILAARRISEALGIKHKVIKLPFFKEFKKCSLITNYQLPISAKKISVRNFLRIRDVWVPNRNGLFINVAACFAEYYGADLIVTGFNYEEAQEFPDNTPEFTKAINESLSLGTLRKVKVVSYVANYTKKEIYRMGLKYNAPLEYIYSCYLGGRKMCGKCASCLRLKNIAD